MATSSEEAATGAGPLEVGTFFKNSESAPAQKTCAQQAAKKRRLARCETDELCHKCIRDNFKNWSRTSCFEVRNSEGYTLFEKLKRDKHARRHDPACTIRFGPGYYQALRHEFSDLESPGKQMVVQNSSEVPCLGFWICKQVDGKKWVEV
eukprot:6491681-Amphidinium_carterae.2